MDAAEHVARRRFELRPLFGSGGGEDDEAFASGADEAGEETLGGVAVQLPVDEGGAVAAEGLGRGDGLEVDALGLVPGLQRGFDFPGGELLAGLDEDEAGKSG